MTDAAPSPAHDEAFLISLRQAAERLVNPWPAGVDLASLSSARAKSVRAAAAEIVNIVGNGKPAPATATPRKAASRSRRSPEQDLAQITEDLETRVGIGLAQLAPLFALDAVKGFGPQKFKAMHEHGLDAATALREPERLSLPGKTGEQLRTALKQVTSGEVELARERAARQLVVAGELGASILWYGHPAYPASVLHSNNPAPVLYARGDLTALVAGEAVACVGSRLIAPPYSDLQASFSRHVARAGFAIVSGFALGADTIGHRSAVEVGGKTICVMPCGLDRPFPPENRELFDRFIATPGVAFVSEFPLGTPASRMTLQKRNKMIVAVARGVLIGQSSKTGGAMNAFKAGVEQKKAVATFKSDGSEATSGNRLIEDDPKASAATFPLIDAAEEWGLVAVAAVLIDLDGTFWDSAPWFASLLAPDDNRERRRLADGFKNPHGGSTAASLIKQRYTSASFRRAAKDNADRLAVYEDALTVLSELGERLPLGVVTNLPGWIAKPMLSAVGAADIFDVVQAAQWRLPAKPHPAGLKMAVHALRLSPSACLFVGDTEVDRRAAAAAGVPYLWAKWGYEAPADVYATIGSWADLREYV